jgi:hydrogenase-4 component B
MAGPRALVEIMIALLAIIGIIVLAAGALLPIVRVPITAAFWLQGTGLALTGLAGAIAFVRDTHVGAGFRSGLHPGLGVDPLSGFFLVVIAVTAIPVLVYASGYLPGTTRTRAVTGLGGGFLLALVGVVCARDALGFLVFWELMTILPAMAILVAKPEVAVRRAIFEYLAITHLGGTGVWITLLVLAERGVLGGGSLSGKGMLLETCVGIAALVGFGSKAGLVPLHVWLPRTHPVAPSHLSALMSGVMIKVALYGLIRVCFLWMNPAPEWMGIALLVVGGLSAVGGVIYALVQHELKRLLAFHSIENVGLITLALGASVVLSHSGQHAWAAIAFAAALLHTLNHALFKALLFLCAGAFERATGELRLDHLGGLLRRMPWTGAAFAVGVVAIAGVPPLNGFVSEWLMLESLLHAGLQGGLLSVMVSAVALSVMAATVGLALFCFVKVGGLVLLGHPRSEAARNARDPGLPMRVGMGLLAGMCLLLGAVPGLIISPLLRLRPGAPMTAYTAGLWLPGTGGLPTAGILIVVVVGTFVLVRARGPRMPPAPVWNCGQIDEPALAWTSAGFTASLRLSLQGVLRSERALEVEREGGIVREIRYQQQVPNLIDRWVYGPIQRTALELAAVARRLQSGSLPAYVGYLVGLVVVLLILARLVGG